MKYWVLSFLAVASVADAAPKWTDESEWAEKKTRPEVYWQDDTPIPFKGTNPLREAMGKAHRAFVQEGWSLWCPSIIKVGDTYHLFCSRWEGQNGKSMKGWTSGHIVRATSKSLTGPYEFQEVVLEPRRGQDFYDSFGVHNPKITKHGDQYILYYIMVPDEAYKKTEAFKNGPGGYQTGIATSDSINGPWKRCDEPVAPFNNPALWIHEDGRVYALAKDKSLKSKAGRNYCRMTTWSAPELMGPYTPLDNQNHGLPNGYEHEDSCVWYAGGQYNILVNDWKQVSYMPGKPLLYYYSKDGVRYHLYSDVPVIHEEDGVEFDDGSKEHYIRMERPNIYLNEKNAVGAVISTALKDYGTNPFIIVWPVDNFYPANSK
jgi:hypothetical protein